MIFTSLVSGLNIVADQIIINFYGELFSKQLLIYTTSSSGGTSLNVFLDSSPTFTLFQLIFCFMPAPEGNLWLFSC